MKIFGTGSLQLRSVDMACLREQAASACGKCCGSHKLEKQMDDCGVNHRRVDVDVDDLMSGGAATRPLVKGVDPGAEFVRPGPRLEQLK